MTSGQQTAYNIGDEVKIKSSGALVFTGVLEEIGHEAVTRGLRIRGRHLSQKLAWRHTAKVTEFLLDNIPSGTDATAAIRSSAPDDFVCPSGASPTGHTFGFEPKEILNYVFSGGLPAGIYVSGIDAFNNADPPTSGNPGVEVSLNFTPYLEVINRFADSLPVSGTASGHWEWRVDNSGGIFFKQRVGTDKSATVQFTTGATGNISALNRIVDGHELINAITVAGAGEQEARYTGFVEDTGSQTTYGLREFVEDEIYYVIGEDPSTAPSGFTLLDRRGQVLVSILKQPIELVSFNTVRSPDDVIPGDTVKVVDDFTGTSGNYKIIEQTVSVGRAGRLTEYQLSNVLQRPYKTPTAFLNDVLHDLDRIQKTSKGGLSGQGPIVEKNIDTVRPLIMPFYVPLELSEVRKAFISVAAQPFRTDISGASGSATLSGAKLDNTQTTGQTFTSASGLTGTPGTGQAIVSNNDNQFSNIALVASDVGFLSLASGESGSTVAIDGNDWGAIVNSGAVYIRLRIDAGSNGSGVQMYWNIYLVDSGSLVPRVPLWAGDSDFSVRTSGDLGGGITTGFMESTWATLPSSLLFSGSTPRAIRCFGRRTSTGPAGAVGYSFELNAFQTDDHTHTATDAGHSNHSLGVVTAGLPTTTRTSEPSTAGGGIALRVKESGVSGTASGNFAANEGLNETAITSITLSSGTINGSGITAASGLVVTTSGAFIDIPQATFPLGPGKFHEVRLFASGWDPAASKAAGIKAQMNYMGFQRQY